MIQKQSQNQILKQLFESPLFAKSETYKKLLTYLVACTLDKKSPNEIEIATQVLGRDSSFDPSEDTLVRVHIYKLRKRLEEYYHEEGKHEKVRLTIPRGRYHVVFESVTGPDREICRKGYVSGLTRIFILATAVLTVLVVWMGIENASLKQGPVFRGRIDGSGLIWSGLLDDGLPVLLVFGSPAIQEALPGTSKDQVPVSDLLCLSKIEPLFTLNAKQTGWKMAYDLEWEDLKRQHVIYFGEYHGFGILEEMFPALHLSGFAEPENVRAPGRMRYHDAKTDTIYKVIDPVSSKNRHTRDYTAVSLVPGPGDNDILIVASFHDLGRMEAVKIMTDRTSLENLEQEFVKISGSVPPYFEMLLEVEGYGDTALYTRVLHVDEVHPVWRTKR
ncbi:hypothetical protein JW948_06690 [bacterium]|nr:hypothetical protein [bacterium]